MFGRWAVLLLVVSVAGALAVLSTPEPAKTATLPAGFDDRLVATAAAPTALAFTPDDRMLVTTQSGKLQVFEDGASRGTALDLGSRICSNSERGLLGVAVDPDFSSNRFVYVYYSARRGATCDNPSNVANRVSRFVLSDGNVASDEKVLIDGIPSPGGNHNAGDLHFGKDDFLYVSVGDGGRDYKGDSGSAGQNDAALDKNVLLGKILRVDREGIAPASNGGGDRCGEPEGDGRTAEGRRCAETFATGLRNPFRMAFDPNASGTRFFINDVGQNAWEEIDEGKLGADYGWNVCEGRHDNPSRPGVAQCNPSPNGLTAPIHEYSHDTGCSSITGGAFVPDGAWPAAYEGSYLFGDYVCGKIFERKPSGQVTEFVTGLGSGSAVHLAFGPAGSDRALYYTTYENGGQVRRIAYAKAPTASIDADKTFGETPLTVDFDGSGSTDPNGDPLTYEWDFGVEGTNADKATGKNASYTYAAAGKFTARLTVTDSTGLTDTATVEVQPGNTPPEPRITSAPTSFRVGQRITLGGTATDAQNQATSLKWQVVRHHNNDHTHPFDNADSGSLSFTAPPPEDLFATNPNANFLEIKLTATDSQGLSKTVSQRIPPRTTSLAFGTRPGGLLVQVNGRNFVAPRTLLAWEGQRLTLKAPNQRENGKRWTFRAWSDGRAQTHDVYTPTNAKAYTARYEAR